MRRTPSQTDHIDSASVATGGSAVRAFDFDRAYAELSAARAQYDTSKGDPSRVRDLAVAAKRLGEARVAMAHVRAA